MLRLADTPFQILECLPRGPTEITYCLSSDCGIQHIAYIETVLGQLHGIFVVNHLVLVRISMKVHALRMDAE